MAVPNRGFGAFLGVGQETTWGTAVARTNWLRVVDLSVKPTLDIVNRDHLGTNGATSTNRRSHFTAAEDFGGTIQFEASYDDTTQLLMAHALGANVTTGAGPFVHTQTLAVPRSLGAIEALTVETGLGTGDSGVFEGMLIDTVEFAVASGEIAMITLGFMGETGGALVAQGTPTFSSGGEIIRHDHVGLFNFNGQTWCLTDVTVSFSKNLTTRHLLGSVNTKEPTANDFSEVTVRITVEYGQTAGLDAAWRAGTQGDGTIAFTGTGNNALALTMHDMYITDVSRPINTAGVVTQTVEFRCESDGTNEGLAFVWTNDNTLYTAN